jgi:hypothetical protein
MRRAGSVFDSSTTVAAFGVVEGKVTVMGWEVAKIGRAGRALPVTPALYPSRALRSAPAQRD